MKSSIACELATAAATAAMARAVDVWVGVGFAMRVAHSLYFGACGSRYRQEGLG